FHLLGDENRARMCFDALFQAAARGDGARRERWGHDEIQMKILLGVTSAQRADYYFWLKEYTSCRDEAQRAIEGFELNRKHGLKGYAQESFRRAHETVLGFQHLMNLRLGADHAQQEAKVAEAHFEKAMIRAITEVERVVMYNLRLYVLVAEYWSTGTVPKTVADVIDFSIFD
ncbi:MAG: hypothetical protein OEW09_10825, partial [Anaerolineae bacterium]|nr:hypothetical protein [Anaerolineae bacterium]